ncbi:MAG: colanic acid/amylovoran biosynthesis protein [Anaerophaga sp.]|nr:colanic acid/amylovoran biosynthesis protein [Anaerophaga sp.]
MSKNILIVQNYNINKGDVSVVHAMQYSLKQTFPEIEINLTSYDPVKAEKEYGADAAYWLIDYSHIKKSNSFIRKIFSLVNEFVWLAYSWIWVNLYSKGIIRKGLMPQKRKKTIDLYLKADVVVLPGGHFFTTLNKFPVLFSHFYSIWFAKKLGKKTMIYAHTIGPFNGLWGRIAHKLTNKVINFCDKITVRESDSLKYNLKEKMILTGETVFLKKNVKDVPLDTSVLKGKDKLVGITIHHIYYSQFFTRDEYIRIMVDILNRIIENYGFDVLFIPMESYRNKEGGDRKMIKDIRDQVEKYDKTQVVKGDRTPEETEKIISTLDFFIGTKTHSIVYALKNCIPTISIAYQEKSNEFMKTFNVRENSIDLKSLNVQDFIEIFDRVANNPQKYRQIERTSLKEVVKNARKNNEVLFELIK